MTTVYYSKSADYQDCRAAIEAVLLPQIEERGGVQGKSVMLKPNLLAWRRPDDIACVHPAVIVETAKIFKAAGASKVALLENPAVQTVPAILQAMGILDELKELGVYCETFKNYCRQETEEKVRFHDLEIAAEFKEYDFVCDICKVKTHAMMTLTLCVKNLFGLVNGSARLGWHLAVGRDFEQFADLLLDLYLRVKPDFNIADGVICMEGNGPGSGNPAERNFFAGSTDSLALDRSVAELLGVKDLLLIQNAGKRNLCTEYRNVGDIPEALPLVLPDPPGIMLSWGLTLPPGIREWMRKTMLSRPLLDPKKCIGCGMCERMCPPHSLKMKNGNPVFHLDTCIRCYCCQEHCPKGAIVSKKTFLMKSLEWIEKRLLRRHRD
ncbi:MAG: DUF362 domain-containing protein [Lentisphaeria bacterium]|nr:DUF362 domain-containing protein [Lentisphaeria bacterium]